MRTFAAEIMEYNQKFLEKATQLFIENGAKTLTMDDVARAFGISKKTLYQKYANKEALLEAVLKFKLEQIIGHLEALDDLYDNALERIFCKDDELEKATATNKSILLKQIIKYYPSIFSKHMQDFADQFSRVLKINIEKGRHQGYYRTDFDEEMYARLFFQMAVSYDSSPFMENSSLDRDHYHQAATEFFLSAITTEDGKNYLKKLKTKYEQMV